MNLSTFLTGGFLAGKRTYILAFAAALFELSRWAVGDQSLGGLIDHLPQIFSDLGLATLRAGIAIGAAPAESSEVESLSATLAIPLDKDVPDEVREWIAGRRGRP